MVHEVTAVMATYNSAPYLAEAVNSILDQTFESWRLIIVDDGSSDSSKDYLSNLRDDRIDIIRLESNRGQGFARNVGISQCRSEFVAIMDADDISLPQRFTKQVAYLHRNPSVGVVGTQFRYLGTDNRSGFGSPLPQTHHRIYANLIAGKHAMVNASSMFRTAPLRSVGAYGSVACGEDWDIFLRLGETARLANLPEILYLYRLHNRSTSASRLLQMRQQYSFAIRNARARMNNDPELTFELFLQDWQRRSVGTKLTDALQIAALANYRSAITGLLHGRMLSGYSQLAFAATLSPSWTVGRLRRIAERSLPRSTWNQGGF